MSVGQKMSNFENSSHNSHMFESPRLGALSVHVHTLHPCLCRILK